MWNIFIKKRKRQLYIDIKEWPGSSSKLLLNEAGEYSLIGWLAHKAGIADKRLLNWSWLLTGIQNRITEHYGLKDGGRSVFLLRHKITMVDELGRVQVV